MPAPPLKSRAVDYRQHCTTATAPALCPRPAFGDSAAAAGGGGRAERDEDLSCSFCHKTFRYVTVRKDHERLHTGERRYFCSHCARGFLYQSQLKRHEVVHTGEKPFTCAVCSQSFNRRSSRDRHEKLHASGRLPKPAP